MMHYHFVIPGEPVAKGRPRVYRVNGMTRTVTPERTVRYEQHVRNCAMLEGVKPIDGPVDVTIHAYWPCPASQHRKREPLAETWRAKKPDADNVAKLVCDALNGIAWNDDAQVVRLMVVKRQASQGVSAKVVVIIHSLEEPHAPAQP